MNSGVADKDFVFVVGCPRSGTYLLSTLLNEHFSVSLPLETHFIHLFHRIKFLWGDLSKFDNRKALLDDIYDFLEVWMKIGHRDMEFTKAVPYSLLATRDKSQNILMHSDSYQDLVAQLFAEYASVHGTEKWGDKTVLYQHVPLDQLECAVPKTKVIHIIRDGRDVCLSWRKTWFGPTTLVEAAKLWSKHVMRKRAWGKDNPGLYLEVRYEDLLEDKEMVMQDIAKFLGLEKSQLTQKNSYSSGMAQALAGPGAHELLSKPIDKSNRGKWKRNMTPYERMLFEYIAGPALQEFGYETENISYSFTTAVQFKLSLLIGSVRTLFSINNFKRRLKAALPVVLLVARKLHLPLMRIMFRR